MSKRIQYESAIWSKKMSARIAGGTASPSEPASSDVLGGASARRVDDVRPSADSADGGAPADLSADLSPQNICARLFWPDSISVISAASTAATTPSSASASRGVAPSSSSSFCVGVSSTCARARRTRGEGARKLDSRDASPSTTHEARALTSCVGGQSGASGIFESGGVGRPGGGVVVRRGERARCVGRGPTRIP